MSKICALCVWADINDRDKIKPYSLRMSRAQEAISCAMQCNALVAIIIWLPAGGQNENHHVCRLHVNAHFCWFGFSFSLSLCFFVSVFVFHCYQNGNVMQCTLKVNAFFWVWCSRWKYNVYVYSWEYELTFLPRQTFYIRWVVDGKRDLLLPLAHYFFFHTMWNLKKKSTTTITWFDACPQSTNDHIMHRIANEAHSSTKMSCLNKFLADDPFNKLVISWVRIINSIFLERSETF